MSHRFPLVILAAKDNAINQKVIRQLLIRLGFEADLVANGAEAVAATGRKKYDLILMDIQMPVMDGIQAMKKIRAGAQPVPRIVALTANALSDDRARLLAEGFDDYLSKPIPVRLLEEMIERQCQLILSRDQRIQ